MAAEPAIDLDLALRVLADRNRRAIMQVIRNEPHQVGAVADELGMSQQAASHHLGVLRRAGLATSTRDAKRRRYGLEVGFRFNLNRHGVASRLSVTHSAVLLKKVV